MRKLFQRYFLLPLATVWLLASCHRDEATAQAGGDTPVAAVQGSLALIKASDFAGFWKHALPPADYATFRADWSRPQPPRPITAQDRAKFTQTVQKLTASGAEATVYAELQPKLAAAEQKYKDQLPLLLGIGQQYAKRVVAQSPTLADAQRRQATAVLDVLGPWAQQVSWFDQGKAKQAVAIVVATARKLDLKSPEQLRSMDFDAAMRKYSTGFAGARQVLLLYGLSIDDTLDSVKLTPLENRNGHARVRIDYTLLGKPLSTESTLVQHDGRWYGEDLLKNARDAHRKRMQPAAASSSAPTVPSGDSKGHGG